MPDAVQITFSQGTRELMQRGGHEFVQHAVARALDRQNELTIGAAVRDRMSFPRTMPPTTEGLRVQTSRLRRSLTRSRAVTTADGVISAIGSNVRYFGPHEYGDHEIHQVKAHTRKLPERYFLSGGQTISVADAGRYGLLNKKGQLRKGLGEKAPTRYVAVRAHLRRANMPERAMVRKTIEARMPLYELEIAERLQKALNA